MSDQTTTHTPLDENKLIAERREKLRSLREAQQQGRGVAFPNDFHPGHRAADLLAHHGAKTPELLAEQGTVASIAGRMMLKRQMGKASFATLQDGTGRFQLYVTRDDVGEEVYAAFKHWDLGDFIAAEGKVFKTRTGELSLHAPTSAAHQEPAPHAGQIPRRGRPGSEVPPALRGPDDRRRSRATVSSPAARP
jgi:lysyl-tRNA synthetase class 2